MASGSSGGPRGRNGHWNGHWQGHRSSKLAAAPCEPGDELVGNWSRERSYMYRSVTGDTGASRTPCGLVAVMSPSDPARAVFELRLVGKPGSAGIHRATIAVRRDRSFLPIAARARKKTLAFGEKISVKLPSGY